VEPLGPGEPAQAGRYRLLAAVGEGGMGRVLLGVAPDGRLAAVKQVHRRFAHDPGFRERFRREVEVSRLVSGAYTAAVMDADPHAPAPWLASVFVAGPSLQEAVDATGPLPPAAVRHLAAGLASALAGIHRAGLVHRDLKPTSPETLRRSDPCKILDNVSVPDAGKLRANPDSAYFDRCDYRTRSGDKISVKLGEQIYVEGGRPAGDLGGRPVLFSEISGSTCDASVQLPAQPELGVTALAETCDLAKTTLGKVLERLRGGAGFELPAGSVVPLDPCAVLDKAAVARTLGPVREVELTRLRECEWTAPTSLRLTFEKLTVVPETGTAVDLGGVTGTRRETGDSCTLTWNHRQFDAKQAEHVRIFATKTGGGACDAAVAFGKALAGKLPKP
jgi:hypothetical protein